VDKPPGPTSHDVVSRVRRALRVKSVGHTGTLDPFASGLLVLLVGRATRVARYLDGLAKTYVGVARLGVRTDTDDRTGAVVGEHADLGGITREAVAAALVELVGPGLQRPPAFSAKVVAGVRSYRRARRGEPIELAAVPVTVHSATLLELAGERVTFRVAVSTGTYIRALARVLGERLGVGAHLAELRRERIGGLDVADAVPLDRVGPGTALLPLTRVLAHLPTVAVSEPERADIRHGRAVMGRETFGPAGAEAVVLTAEGAVIAVARPEAGRLRPAVVLESA
jgi:tRNA pseudouridine55 synthase